MNGTVSICTLGCRVNKFESEAIADAAQRAGLKVVGWGQASDLAVFNSCALTVLAEAKTRNAMRAFARKNPDSFIAVTGCYAQTAADALAEMPNVKWVVGNAAKLKTIDIISANPPQKHAQIFHSAPSEACGPLMLADTPLEDRMNLKIQDGCDNACSYCIIPRARGLPRSRDFGEIIADAKNIVSRGVREIIITGINISKFSSPHGTLVNLVDELADIKGLLRLRIGSMEPPHICLEELLERMADISHPLCPHLHVSAQSLSDKVLQAMRRKYSSAEFLNAVKIAREKIPHISIGTDIICGHPGEDETDFLETREKLKNSGMAYAHIFTFSPRPKTLAATMKNTPPKPERKSRADLLRETAAALSEAFIQSQTGTTRTILLENQLANGDYIAYTDNYMQVAVNIKERGLKNKLAKVKLTSPITPALTRAEFIDLV